MVVRADETVRGVKYRPTRTKYFDLRGRAWLTRAAPAWERRAVQKMRLNYRKLTGRSCFILDQLRQGAVLMRKHRRVPGCKTTQSEWVSVPHDYPLRGVKR